MSWTYKDFEDYLQEVFHKTDGCCVLDDDLPDAFNDWLCNLDIEEWLEYGEKYAQTKIKEN